MTKICIAGLCEYPGLVTFGRRIIDQPKTANHYNIYIHISSNSNDTTGFESDANDKIIAPFLSCYLYDRKHHVDAISVQVKGDCREAALGMLRAIPDDIKVTPDDLKPISNTKTPLVEDLLKLLKEEGNKLLRAAPGSSEQQIQQTFDGYAKAADLYMSAIYAVRGLPHDGSQIQLLVLECFSNLLLACLKLKAYDIADGVVKEGVAKQYVRNTQLPEGVRSRCLYRIAQIQEIRQRPTDALNHAIAAWHISPDEGMIQVMVNRLLQGKPSACEPTGECVFCMSAMTGGGDIGSHVETLECGHTFHTRCVEPWLRFFGGTCPLCRRK